MTSHLVYPLYSNTRNGLTLMDNPLLERAIHTSEPPGYSRVSPADLGGGSSLQLKLEKFFS
jgi:hypothetical protein